MKGKTGKRFLSVLLSALMAGSAFSAAVPAAYAADNDFLATVYVADVTKRYDETGDLLDLINEYRSDNGCDDLVYDRATTNINDCFDRAVELPVSFSTTDLQRSDYNFESDNYSSTYPDVKTYEFVFQYVGSLNSLNSLTAVQNSLGLDYKVILKDPDLTETTIGIVSVNGENRRYVCMRLTNLKSEIGTTVSRKYTSDQLRAKGSTTETEDLTAYISLLNLQTSEYDDFTMDSGTTQNVYIKAQNSSGTAYIKTMPRITITNTGVFSSSIDNCTVTAKKPGTSTVSLYYDAKEAGQGTKSYSYTFTSLGKSLANLTTDEIPAQDYTGSAITPKPAIYDEQGTALTEGTDYSLSYLENTAPGTGFVVFTGIGQYAGTSKTVPFTIVAPEEPLAISLDVSAEKIMIGDSVTVTATVAGGTDPVSSALTVNGTALEVDAEGKVVYTPEASGTYNFKLSASDGNGSSDFIIKTVKVKDPVDVSLSAEKSIVEVGKSAVLTAQSGTAVSYKFELIGTDSRVLQEGASSSCSFSAEEAGEYTFKVTAEDEDGETISDTTAVTFYNALKASLSMEDGPFEVGSQIAAAVTVTGGYGNVNTTLKVNNEELTIDSQGNAYFTPSGTGEYNFVLTSTDEAGTTVTDEKTVNAKVFIDVSLSASRERVPVGEQVTFTAASNTATEYRFFLVTDSGLLSLQTGSNSSYTTRQSDAGEYTVKVIAFDADMVSASDQITVTYYSMNADIYTSAEKVVVGNAVTIETAAWGGTGQIAKKLTVNGNEVNLDSNGKASFIPQEPGEYIIVFTATDDAGGSAVVRKTVKAKKPVLVTLSAENDRALTGNTINLNAASETAVSYKFELVGTELSTLQEGTDSSYSFQGTEKGDYTIRVTAFDEDGDSATDIADISFYDELTAGLALSSQAVKTGDIVTIYPTWDGGYGDVGAVVTVDNSVIEKNASGEYTFSSETAGRFTVKVTVTDSLGNTDNASKGLTVSDRIAVQLNVNTTETYVGGSVIATSESNKAVSYKFELISGETATTVQSGSDNVYVFNAEKAGDYTIKVTAYDSDNESAESTQNIKVYEKVSASLTGVPEKAYTGEEITVNAAAANGKGTLAMTLTVNGNAIELENGQATFKPTTAGVYTFELKAVDENGETATATAAVTVKDKITLSVSADKDTACVGEEVKITADSNTGVRYVFGLGETTLQDSENVYYVFTSDNAGEYTIQVTAFDKDGEAASDSVTITYDYPELVNKTVASAEEIAVGDRVRFTASAEGGLEPYTYTFEYKKSGSEIWRAFGSEASAVFKPGAPAEFSVRVIVEDSRGTKAEKLFNVSVSYAPTGLPLENKSTVSAESFELGGKTVITASASGGTEPYSYTYEYRNITKNGAWRSFGSGKTATFKPGAIGQYGIRVTVTDGEGNTDVKEFTVVAKNASTGLPLENNSTVSAESFELGGKTVITASASGGTEPYSFTFEYRNVTKGGKWIAFGSGKSVAFKPGAVGIYEIRVTVTDGDGNSEVKVFTITAKAASTGLALENNSTVSTEEFELGGHVRITAAASGGTQPYSFSYQYRNVTKSGAWRSFGSGTSTAFKPGAAGVYELSVNLTDGNGDSKNKTFTITVK